ncbi:MAG: C45 family autoproteolytic acyltransferase/hydolase [Limisphaerales bacterium]
MIQARLTFLAVLAGLSVAALGAEPAAKGELTADQQGCVAKAKRFERAGWVYLHVEGEARDRGFQHGYLLAKEIAEGLRMTRASWEHESAMPWTWLVNHAAAMFVPKIDAENLAELDGIAQGARAAGFDVSRDDVIAYNGIIELQSYWWPIQVKKLKDAPPGGTARQSCSSFVATGSWTKDGNVVLGHNTMQGYADALPLVVEDIAPSKGHRILWQTTAGWIHSGTDFFITDAGLVGSETTIGGFDGFDTNGIPEFTRMRRATQDAASLDQWCEIMKRGNNGGYANAWLLGDVNSREIARLELGLKYVAFEKKRDGYFIGSNVAEDRKILKMETDENDADIRLSSVARRVRWKQLMKDHAGKIDVELAKRFEADHFDAFRGKVWPGGKSLCGHFERDPEANGHGVPFECSGTVDGKVVDAAMAKQMSFSARWGAACGMPFVAGKFLAAHPQFDWMTGLLKDRPAEPWALFTAGE